MFHSKLLANKKEEAGGRRRTTFWRRLTRRLDVKCGSRSGDGIDNGGAMREGAAGGGNAGMASQYRRYAGGVAGSRQCAVRELCTQL